MKLISTGQLASILKVPTKNIHTYHSRGKINFVKERGRNYIDLEDKVNEKFILEQTAKLGNVVLIEDINPEDIVKAKKRAKPVKKANNKEKPKGRTVEKVISPVSEYDLHRTNKMEQDAKIAALKLAKLKGGVIPLDQAQMLFQMHFANVSTEFYNMIDNYTVVVVDKLNGNRKDLAGFRSKLKQMVNETIEYAKEKTKEELESKAVEYSKSKAEKE